MSVRALFTGYAPVHAVCFLPIYERLLATGGWQVSFSGGLGKTDAAGLYAPLGIPRSRIVDTADLAALDVDVLFVANTRAIRPRTVGTQVQIFHGVSYRNRAVRKANMESDVFFVVGPYMARAFEAGGLMSAGDPRAVPIGFPKTDRLVDGTLDRADVLDRCGFAADRPVVLYAPTGARHNSMETMGDAVIGALERTDRFDVIVKSHDHPKGGRVEPTPRGPRVHVCRDADVVPLLHAADLLITDASSVSSEYALLDRPMVFLDVPELLAHEMGRKTPTMDMDTWGRRVGRVVASADDVVATVDSALANPAEHGELRRAMAADLFYNPGTATDAAIRWLETIRPS